ncbi:ATP-grasp domain-containing protein [Marinitenerispora sediminis]|uniref:Carbamoylphosphate synthase n=1 Tax=Marinitenerispora sediminis TaxID=1931232 RepID=A0A368T6M6_9ACTN|nr:ATP-grasp domain-containing protein [Marinitenerispora sediminis]RCV50645.1 carbamoylphosphate synthase [Marinitenerispora sediminis]RCV56213.1 carbamoylphosphate synthase [Marinitenerispora sediminis]RCV59444.1 carbamoylphosphate synthase [Marinitenerispora sediminis]
MVTTAGSAPTPGAILRLRALGYRVVATDVDPAAPGLYLADRGYLVPPGGSTGFLPEIRGICAKEEAGAVVPLVDEELDAVTELEDDGIAVLAPRREFVRTCLDKALLMARLADAGVPVPETRSAAAPAGDLVFPVVVKPRTGRGGRGVAVCASPAELARRIEHGGYPAADLIVQELLAGTEFTVSVVVWRDGAVQAVVPKEVILKRGVTQYAVTRRHERVAQVCRAVQRELRADGPFNVQLALDAAGEPRVFEINPRFSSTAPLTVAAGVDEIGGLLGQALAGGPRLADDWRDGVVMVRRWAEEFVDEADFVRHGVLPVADARDRGRDSRAGR